MWPTRDDYSQSGRPSLALYTMSSVEKKLERDRRYRKSNRELLKNKSREYRKQFPERIRKSMSKYRKSLRMRSLQYIADLRTKSVLACECCGEIKIEFLSFDHINGGGRRDMRSSLTRQNFYNSILRGERDSILRVLCYNCNCSLGHNGYCPHDIK